MQDNGVKESLLHLASTLLTLGRLEAKREGRAIARSAVFGLVALVLVVQAIALCLVTAVWLLATVIAWPVALVLVAAGAVGIAGILMTTAVKGLRRARPFANTLGVLSGHSERPQVAQGPQPGQRQLTSTRGNGNGAQPLVPR